ncbi:MAG: N-acetylmuramic acid 6-phosphate etherase [Candidatus Tyrphobacter sp.]
MRDLPETEAVAQQWSDLDRLPADTLVERLLDAQAGVAQAVAAQSGAIAGVVEEVCARLRSGGRLHYVGAGTSGRLAVLDAAEMPPTFGTEPDLVTAHIAGGTTALVRAIEGAEDDADAGAQAMREIAPEDAVIGVSASGGAAYVVAAIARARDRGAFTAAIVNSQGSALERAAQRAIVVRTGAEPIAGSTRLRAATAQKIVLNAISTATMVLLGKVYENLMVDVAATNAKLRARAIGLVERIARVDTIHAERLLESAGWNVKVAVVTSRRNCDVEEARDLLARHAGVLRDALSSRA